MSEWDDVLLYPGGNPHHVISSADFNENLAIAYVANYEHPGYTSVSDLMYALIGTKDTTNRAEQFSGGPALIYLGDCLPLVSGNCDGGANDGISPIGSSWGWGKGQYFPNIPIGLALTVSRGTFDDASTSTTGDPGHRTLAELDRRRQRRPDQCLRGRPEHPDRGRSAEQTGRPRCRRAS